MAEPTTVARPYAEAAFELAREQNALPVWSEMLRFATMIVGDERVAAALDNPRLSAGDKEALVLSIAELQREQDSLLDRMAAELPAH